MDGISSQLALLASHDLLAVCAVIYGSTIFLGNIAAFTSLWVAFGGTLGVWGVPCTIVAIFAANVSGDILWYSMGRGLRTTRLGRWIRGRIPNHENIESHVAGNGLRWMLFAKFVYGSNFPIIFSLGWSRVPFHSFFRRSLQAIALWLPLILGVSYGLYSGLAPLAVAISDVRTVEILFLLGLVLFIVVQYVLVGVFKRVWGKDTDRETAATSKVDKI
jgi:membrane protein DedA with SNARE-associated domain